MKNMIILILILAAPLGCIAGTGKPTRTSKIRFWQTETNVFSGDCNRKKSNTDSPLTKLSRLKNRLTTYRLGEQCRVYIITGGALAKMNAARGIYSDCYPSKISFKIIYKF